MVPLTLSIEGMSCGHCQSAVSRALTALRGVTVKSVEIGRAILEYDPGEVGPAQIAAAVEESGYRVAGQN